MTVGSAVVGLILDNNEGGLPGKLVQELSTSIQASEWIRIKELNTKQEISFHPLKINRAPVEKVNTKYLDVYIRQGPSYS